MQRFHAYFMHEVDSWSIIVAGLLPLLVSLADGCAIQDNDLILYTFGLLGYVWAFILSVGPP